MKENKGFTLVELIIVMAIMAVLVVGLVPQYLQYVARTKRTADVVNAKTIADTLQKVAVVDEGTLTYISEGEHDGYQQSVINENSTGNGTDLISLTIKELGRVPKAKYNDNLWWCILYNTSTGKAQYIYLVKSDGAGPPDSSKGYKVYPDGNEYISSGEMVPIK